MSEVKPHVTRDVLSAAWRGRGGGAARRETRPVSRCRAAAGGPRRPPPVPQSAVRTASAPQKARGALPGTPLTAGEAGRVRANRGERARTRVGRPHSLPLCPPVSRLYRVLYVTVDFFMHVFLLKCKLHTKNHTKCKCRVSRIHTKRMRNRSCQLWREAPPAFSASRLRA